MRGSLSLTWDFSRDAHNCAGFLIIVVMFKYIVNNKKGQWNNEQMGENGGKMKMGKATAYRGELKELNKPLCSACIPTV